ncbi:MAG: DegT/DnrJ/EryC1/StrS family aminotransferase [Armatimonadetes bacterium]|nr:DegT/DnrJ/EryC1/StrS family aminotransferase [Armatimonadota bacterium]
MDIREVPFPIFGGLYEQDDIDAVMKVVTAAADNGNFFPLPEEIDFQNMLAEHEGARRAVAVNSCGTALDCCMMALGIKEGDEMITTPLTFVCTAGAAVARGAKVVFADIDPVTMNIDPSEVRKKITERTKAIIGVHFSGLACDLDELDKISAETGIPVIYDAAHAVGAKYKGQPIGGRGLANCYSFQSNKNMTCLGEGGAVTSNDEEFIEKVRQLKTFGYVYSGPAPVVTSIGFNYRMTKAQCAVGMTQLAKIDRVVKARQERMTRMSELLADAREIILPAGHGPGHGSHLYVLRVNTDRVKFSQEEFSSHLKSNYKVGTTKHYEAVWNLPAFSELGYTDMGCPLAARACDQVFSAPISHRTSPEELEYIAWAMKQTIMDLA